MDTPNPPTPGAILWHNLRQGVWQGLVLLILAAVIGLGVNALRPDGLPLTPQPVAKPATGVIPITLSQAWQIHGTGQAVFLDARDPFLFAQGHIPGALNVPPGKSAGIVATLTARSGQPVICYCDGPECGAAEKLAAELAAQGIPGVRVMTDGWYAWSNAGYPVEGQGGSGR